MLLIQLGLEKVFMNCKILFIFLSLILSVSSYAKVNAQKTGNVEISKMIEEHEKLNGIPKGILKSIAKVESGIRPYIVNNKGKAHFFKSKDSALSFVQGQLKNHNQNFSVGCMQLHYKSHKNKFNSVEEMLSPEKNLGYAAAMLKKLFDKYGNWETAIKRYHAAKTKLSENYYKKVMRVYNSLKV